MRLAGQAQHRRSRLTSNVRPRERTWRTVSALRQHRRAAEHTAVRRSPVILASRVASPIIAAQPRILRRSTALPDRALASWHPLAGQRPPPGPCNVRSHRPCHPHSVAYRSPLTLAGSRGPGRARVCRRHPRQRHPRRGGRPPPSSPHRLCPQARPNPSVEARPNGIALGPRGAFCLSCASRAKRNTVGPASPRTLGLARSPARHRTAPATLSETAESKRASAPSARRSRRPRGPR
jgi:hypothetical protein